MRRSITLRMKYRSISSVTSKSAITPWRSGRVAEIEAGVRPIIRSASAPTAWTSPVRRSEATTDGSDTTIPLPPTYTSVLAVPRSIAMSCTPRLGISVRLELSRREPSLRSLMPETVLAGGPRAAAAIAPAPPDRVTLRGTHVRDRPTAAPRRGDDAAAGARAAADVRGRGRDLARSPGAVQSRLDRHQHRADRERSDPHRGRRRDRHSAVRPGQCPPRAVVGARPARAARRAPAALARDSAGGDHARRPSRCSARGGWPTARPTANSSPTSRTTATGTSTCS